MPGPPIFKSSRHTSSPYHDTHPASTPIPGISSSCYSASPILPDGETLPMVDRLRAFQPQAPLPDPGPSGTGDTRMPGPNSTMSDTSRENSASFWAQRRKEDESSCPAAHPTINPLPLTSPQNGPDGGRAEKASDASAVKETPKSASIKISNFFLKPTTFNWADDEDEDMLAVDPRDIRIQALPSELDRNHPRMEQLQQRLAVKDGHIQDLEEMIQERDHAMEALEWAVQSRDQRIDELKIKAEGLELQIQKLAAGMNGQIARIKELECLLDAKDAHIQKLEAELTARDEIASDSAPKAILEEDEPKSTFPPAAAETNSLSPVAPIRAVSEDISIPDSPATTSKSSPTLVPEPSTPSPEQSSATPLEQLNPPPKQRPPKMSPKTLANMNAEVPTEEHFPCLRSTCEASPMNGSVPTPFDGHPVFVTPETIKKVKPVPPAPKLKLGIDISKFGKKPDPKLATKPAGKPLGPKRSEDSDVMPAIEPYKDIRKMSRAERELFGRGPDVTIMMGNTILGNIAKYMFMQCSDKAFAFFSKNPTATSMRFPASSMNEDAAKLHINWMHMHTFCARVFSVHLAPQNDDKENLHIAQAARVLGLNNVYVGHFTRQYCDRIRQHLPSYELMSLIDEAAYPENDPIFDCLANNIANQRQRGSLQHPEEVAEFLTKHPKLAAAIQKIEGRAAGKVPKKINGDAAKPGPHPK